MELKQAHYFAIGGVIAVAAFILFIIFAPEIIKPQPYEVKEYKGFEFRKIDNLWHTDWKFGGQTYTISLHYHPSEVEDIPVQGKLNATFQQTKVYATFDPKSPRDEFKYLALAMSELGLSIVRAFGFELETACTSNQTEACEKRPIATCDTDDKPVVYLQSTGEPRVILDGNCVILQGDKMELLKAVDYFLYKQYRVIQ